MARPERLPRWAYRIVLGSTELPAEQKLLWQQIEHLDQGPDGAWIGTEALAERLGMPTRTLERHRTALLHLGLLHVRRRGPKHASWYPVIPTRLPAREDLIPNAILALDAHVRRAHATPEGGERSATAVAEQGGGSSRNVPPPVAEQGPAQPARSATRGGSSEPALKRTAVGGEEGLRLPADVVSPPTQGERVAESEARSREQKRQSEARGAGAQLEAAFLAMGERVRATRGGDPDA